MAGAIISSLDGARGIAGWRWLLLVEGIITVFCGWCCKSYLAESTRAIAKVLRQCTSYFPTGLLIPRCYRKSNAYSPMYAFCANRISRGRPVK